MSLNDKPQWDLFDDYHTNPEYDLYDSVINEATTISGFPIYYWIKTNTENADYLYGEDPVEQFKGPYESKITYEPTEEEEVLSSFGLSSDDTLQYVQIPRTKFSEDIGDKFGDIDYIPKPGDALQLLWNGKTYNIMDVGSEQNIFLARKMVWELICRPFSFSEESSSAEDVMFSDPPSGYFDEDNTLTTTEPLSAYGENEKIENESYANPDEAVYGFN